MELLVRHTKIGLFRGGLGIVTILVVFCTSSLHYRCNQQTSMQVQFIMSQHVQGTITDSNVVVSCGVA